MSPRIGGYTDTLVSSIKIEILISAINEEII